MDSCPAEAIDTAPIKNTAPTGRIHEYEVAIGAPGFKGDSEMIREVSSSKGNAPSESFDTCSASRTGTSSNEFRIRTRSECELNMSPNRDPSVFAETWATEIVFSKSTGEAQRRMNAIAPVVAPT